MQVRERLRSSVRSFNIEVLALWFAFRDRRVRWYVKAFLLVPIAYVISPFDLLQDMVIGIGQLDDLVVLRAGHFLLSRFIDPEVMTDSRGRSAAFLDAGLAHRAAFYLAITAVWGITILLVVQWFVKRFMRTA